MCDIEAMFHQVRVRSDCRDFLRFFWWEDGDVNGNPVEFRRTVHFFGAVSSPGCCNFALKRSTDDTLQKQTMKQLTLFAKIFMWMTA
jgi:hypothetical protein